jgi:uncharacterized protein YbjQ (UPF0145 family)
MEPVTVLVMVVFLLSAFGPMLLGIVGGRITEAMHFKSLDRRALEFEDMLISQVKSFPERVPGDRPPTLVVAEVVVASDYLKTFLASLRKIIGGEVRSFEKMQRRARREAILRLLKQAREQGYNAICNVRLDTADIGGGATMSKNPAAVAAILASATAYHAEE